MIETYVLNACLFRDNGVSYATLRDIQLVVNYFDLDKDGSLNYQE